MFVHGIGQQRQGETLVDWGNTLVDTVNRGCRGHATASVKHATLSPGGSSASAELTLRIRDEESDEVHEEQWHLVEAWWADEFDAPSYKRLALWSMKAVPWALFTHMAQRLRQERPLDQQSKKHEKVRHASKAFVRYAVATPGALLFMLLMLALLVIGLIPIPQIRTFVARTQRVLTVSVGDSLVLIESPIVAAAIKSSVKKALVEAESRGCREITVLAHSQGAAVAREALDEMEPLRAETGEPSKKCRVDRLVTFGAGINKLAALKKASDPRLRTGSAGDQLYENPIRVALIAFVVAVGGSVWGWINVAMGKTTRLELLLYPVVLIVTSLIATGIGVFAGRIMKDGRKNIVQGIVGAVFMAALIFAMVIYDGATEFVLPDSVAIIALIFLAAAVQQVTSGKFGNEIRDLVTTPKIVRDWKEFYASSDPVPAGATERAGVEEWDSREIHTTGSWFADHTSYWRNRDGFVLPLLGMLSDESELLKVLPESRYFEQVRMVHRVQWLQFARRLILALGVGLSISLFPEFGAMKSVVESWLDGLPFGAGSWFPEIGGIEPAAGATVGLLLLLMWIGNAVLRSLWWVWVKEEHKAVLEHQSLDGSAPISVLFFVAVALVSAAAFFVAVERWTPSVVVHWTDPPLLFFVLPLSIVIAQALMKYRNPA